jgi:hypothetical protein
VRRRVLRWAIVVPLAAAASLGCTGGGPDPGPEAPDELAVEALPEDLAFALSEDAGNADVTDSSFEEMFPTPNPSATPFPLPLPPDVMDQCPFDTDPPERPPRIAAGHSRTISASTVATAATDRFSFRSAALSALVFESKEAADDALEASVGELEDGESPLLLSDECIDAYQRFLSDENEGGDVVLVQREREPGFSIPGVRIWQVKTTVSASEDLQSTVSTVALFEYDYVVGRYSAFQSNDESIDHEALIRAFVDQVVEAQSGG